MISVYALVAKLADALDSGSSGATLGGSNPLERSEASEKVQTAGGENRLGQGWVCGGQILSSPDKSRDKRS